ncbi:MAG: tRNA (guanosine(37)-N1)-methyltransferase TrmD, partial [Lachnospiraceae bacterium]|nr:tRNA (guanosine(37)-N1)-methyltransferase TrmD [Lachnospiraceae bacterium]
MRISVLTLFPEMIMQTVGTSILGRAVDAGHLDVTAVNIRDYAFNKHHKVDDYPYGGGAGMLMQAEPVYLAYEAALKDMKEPPRVIYTTPQGKRFDQKMAAEF